MDIQHHEMVAKLMKAPEAIYATLTHARINLQHAAIGIGDELFELACANTREHRLEEMGDLLFYIESLLLHTGLNRESVLTMHFEHGSNSETMVLLFQTVKRCVFYEQPLNEENLIRAYLGLRHHLQIAAKASQYTLEDVQAANMAKLAKPYADFEYSDTRAKERVDKVGTDEEEKLPNLSSNPSGYGVANADCVMTADFEEHGDNA